MKQKKIGLSRNWVYSTVGPVENGIVHLQHQGIGRILGRYTPLPSFSFGQNLVSTSLPRYKREKCKVVREPLYVPEQISKHVTYSAIKRTLHFTGIHGVVILGAHSEPEFGATRKDGNNPPRRHGVMSDWEG